MAVNTLSKISSLAGPFSRIELLTRRIRNRRLTQSSKTPGTQQDPSVQSQIDQEKKILTEQATREFGDLKDELLYLASKKSRIVPLRGFTPIEAIKRIVDFYCNPNYERLYPFLRQIKSGQFIIPPQVLAEIKKNRLQKEEEKALEEEKGKEGKKGGWQGGSNKPEIQRENPQEKEGAKAEEKKSAAAIFTEKHGAAPSTLPAGSILQQGIKNYPVSAPAAKAPVPKPPARPSPFREEKTPGQKFAELYGRASSELPPGSILRQAFPKTSASSIGTSDSSSGGSSSSPSSSGTQAPQSPSPSQRPPRNNRNNAASKALKNAKNLENKAVQTIIQAYSKWPLIFGVLLILFLFIILGFSYPNYSEELAPLGGEAPTGAFCALNINGCTFYRANIGAQFGNPAMANIVTDVSAKVGVPPALVAGIMRIECGDCLTDQNPSYVANDYDAHGSSAGAIGIMQFLPDTFAGIFKAYESEMASLFGKTSVDVTIPASPPAPNSKPEALKIYSIRDSVIATAFKLKADNPNKDGTWDEFAVRTVASLYYSGKPLGQGCTKYPSCSSGPNDYGTDLWTNYSTCTVRGKPIDSGTSTTNVSDGSVTIIGDSITHGAESDIKALLPKASITAQDSKHFAADVSGNQSGISILTEIKNNNQLQPVLVFALGTNDDANTMTYANMQKVLDLAGDSKVIFVTVHGTPDAAVINQRLTTFASTNASKVSIADWDSIAAAHPEWFGTDGIHPNAEGQKEFAKVIAKAIAEVSSSAPTTDLTIVLDPGHSGTDSQRADPETGLLDHDYPNIPEINEVFGVAQKVKQKLEADGYKVIMTKNSVNDSISHRGRADIADKANAALAVSIHNDHDQSWNNFAQIYVQEDDLYRCIDTNDNEQCDTNETKVSFSNPGVAQKSQQYGKIFATERTAAEGRNAEVVTNSFDGREGIAPGNIPLVQLFTKVPWVYNEVGANGNLSEAEIDKYAQGIVNGIEKSVPIK